MPTRRKSKSAPRKIRKSKVVVRHRSRNKSKIPKRSRRRSKPKVPKRSRRRSKPKVPKRSRRRSKSKSKNKRKNYDGVGFNDIPIGVLSENIYNSGLSCVDQRNIFLISREYNITPNTCPEIKFRYIIRQLRSELIVLSEEDRKDFLLKLKVFICLNPKYIPNEYTFTLIGANLTNIALIKSTTTTIDNNNINVLNCRLREFPINLRPQLENLQLYMKPIEYNIQYLPNGLGGMGGILQNIVAVRSVVFYGFEENLGDDFCYNHNFIQRISYAGLTSLKSIGNRWMSKCGSLIHIDFNGLTYLRSVGYSWLSGCQRLTEVNFTGLPALRTVGDYWINNCSFLTNINFNSLFSIISVGYNWMSHSPSLVNPNFNGLTSLQTVKNGWMKYCPSLRRPNFNGLLSIESVGSEWMDHCPSLEIQPRDIENPILREILTRELNNPHRNFVSVLHAW